MIITLSNYTVNDKYRESYALSFETSAIILAVCNVKRMIHDALEIAVFSYESFVPSSCPLFVVHLIRIIFILIIMVVCDDAECGDVDLSNLSHVVSFLNKDMPVSCSHQEEAG